MSAVNVYTDENNGKSASYEADDHNVSFLGELCSSCEGVSFSIASDENGSRLEAAFPFGEAVESQKQIGFDIRVTLISQLDKPISWSDQSHSQEITPSKFGTLTLVDTP